MPSRTTARSSTPTGWCSSTSCTPTGWRPGRARWAEMGKPEKPRPPAVKTAIGTRLAESYGMDLNREKKLGRSADGIGRLKASSKNSTGHGLVKNLTVWSWLLLGAGGTAAAVYLMPRFAGRQVVKPVELEGKSGT